MKKLKVIGLSLLLAGIIFVLDSQKGTTGPVVAERYGASVGTLIGLTLIIGGVVLFGFNGRHNRNLERLVSEDEYVNRFIDATDNPQSTSIVLDSSAIFVGRIINKLKNSGFEIYVPGRVLKEIKNSKVRNYVEKNTKRTTDIYKESRKEALQYLAETPKAKMYKEVYPLVKKYLEGKSLTNREFGTIKRQLPNIQILANKDNYQIGSFSTKKDAKAIADYLNRNCKVSGADTEVLATAMGLARQGKYTLVGEKDSDIKKSLDMIKREYPQKGEIGERLSYVEPYAA